MNKEHLEKDVKDHPSDPEAHFQLGDFLLDSGDLQESVDSFMRVLRIDSGYGKAYIKLGKAYMKLNRMQEAMNSMINAIKLLPDSLEAYLLQGQACLGAGCKREAVETLEEAGKLFLDEPMIPFRLGMALAESKEYVEAEKAYRKAIELKPDFAQAHNNLGAMYMNLGMSLMAAKSFDEAAAIDPGNAVYMDNLGRAYAGLLKYDDAVKFHLESLKRNPRRAATHLHISQTYLKMERRALALQAARKAVELDENNPDNNLHLAEILVNGGYLDEIRDGLKICKECLKRWPDQVDVLNRVALMYLHSCQTYKDSSTLQINGWQKAEELLGKALKIEPDNVVLHRNIATAIMIQGIGGEYTKKAVKHLSEIVRLSPDSAEDHFKLGRYLMRSKFNRQGEDDIEHLQQAVHYLKKAIRLDPKISEAYTRLAEAYDQLGWEQLAEETRKKREENTGVS